jgi:hypothetical protein
LNRFREFEALFSGFNRMKGHQKSWQIEAGKEKKPFKGFLIVQGIQSGISFDYRF